jgi:tetratricopeptide (TPR) repeat protein
MQNKSVFCSSPNTINLQLLSHKYLGNPKTLLKNVTWVLVFLFWETSLYGSSNYEFTNILRKAYTEATGLRLDQASNTLKLSQQKDPDNLLNVLIGDYIDFFRVFINNDKDLIKELEQRKVSRLNKLKKSNSQSPYHLYSQAEINLHWGIIYLQAESYWSAYHHIKKAYKLFTKNQYKHPEFIANYKSLGILHAAVGTIPDQFKRIFSFFSGMKGTISQGKDELKKVIEFADRNPDYLFKDETYALYALLLVHLNNQGDEAWEVLKTAAFSQADSPLIIFCKANVAMRTWRNDEAIQLLTNYQQQITHEPFHYLNFMTGLTLLRKLDLNCIPYFEKYLMEYSGDNYVKEAYQKLGWCAIIQEDPIAYRDYLSKAFTRGSTQIDGDKNAFLESKEASRGAMPNRLLLQSRLLFDGGYYKRASKLLIENVNFIQSDHTLKLEYNYRLGRIYHQLKDISKALFHYQQTILQGRDLPEYFACNAALQMGIIYENLNDLKKAAKYYNLCLAIHPDDYRRSLHMKAEAGLNRMNK